MTTFSKEGRDLSGWKTLLDLTQSLFEKPEMAGLRASIIYSRQMPQTSPLDGGSVDIVAGTGIVWNLPDDDLDHHWQVRRIERLAPLWRGLLPSDMDFEGWSDAECSIELTAGKVMGLASRENGEDTDSTIAILHELDKGFWNTKVEISWACYHAASDILAMDDDEVIEQIEQHQWYLHGARPAGYRLENDDMIVTVKSEVLALIDREPEACAA